MVNEIIPTLALTHVCFFFPLCGFLFEMLEAVDTACLEGQRVKVRYTFQQAAKKKKKKNCGETVTDIIQNIK